MFTLLVGAYYDDDPGHNSGSAYVIIPSKLPYAQTLSLFGSAASAAAVSGAAVSGAFAANSAEIRTLTNSLLRQ